MTERQITIAPDLGDIADEVEGGIVAPDLELEGGMRLRFGIGGKKKR